MSLHLLAPMRPQPVPVAGTFFSLATHGAMLAALVGGDGLGMGQVDAPAARGTPSSIDTGAEELHWVGIAAGSGGGVSPTRRPGAPPPLAYVVPGRGGSTRVAGFGSEGARGRPPQGDASRRSAGAVAPPARDATRPSAPRPARRTPGVALPAVPDVAWSDADATLLVAGVISAAPDLARRVSRPEDFVPATPAALMGSTARVGIAGPELVLANLHIDDLPVPLVNNPLPSFPAALERRHVGGRVVVEFLIDSTGAVDVGTLKVVQSSDTLFTDAVRTVLPRLRFLPAQLKERAIGVMVRQPFLFTFRGERAGGR